MMNRKRKDMYVLILVLAAVIGTITLAYAALSATLNVGFGNITQDALSWSVGFQGTTATATTGGTSSTGRSCGTASVSSSTVTVGNTTLSKPGDSCTYALTIKNSGTIAATLSSITPKSPTSTTCSTLTGGTMVCGNLTYKLTTDSAGSSVLTNNRSLAVNATLPVYLVVSYSANSLASSSSTQSGAAFTLSYTQA